MNMPLQVEFNKAALSLADSLGEDLKKVALNRLLKVRAHILARTVFLVLTVSSPDTLSMPKVGKPISLQYV